MKESLSEMKDRLAAYERAKATYTKEDAVRDVLRMAERSAERDCLSEEAKERLLEKVRREADKWLEKDES